MRNKPSPFAVGERLPGIVYQTLKVRGQSQKYTWKQFEDCDILPFREGPCWIFPGWVSNIVI